MEFVRPTFLWGLLATLLPIWIHFYGFRPRKAEVIPSLIFLKTLKKSRRSKHRIKDLIVLLLRMMIIAFVVLSLAGPNRSAQTASLQIDNYPAHWSKKADWLKPLLNSLENGNYKVYDRESNFYGQFEKESLWSVCSTMPYSTRAFQKAEESLTLSFGFAEDIRPPALLPLRTPIENKELVIQSSEMGNYLLKWKGMHEVLLLDSAKLIDRSLDSLYRVTYSEIANASLLSFEVGLDDVLEDNKVSWSRISQNRRLILYKSTLSNLESFASPKDSIIAYSSDETLDYSKFDAVVLIGLEFIPASLKGFKGRLLQFTTTGEQIAPTTTVPSLDHPFFNKYFIGPSLQNKWPIALGCLHDSVAGAPLLLAKDNPVAVMDGQHYIQGFVPNSWSHPYYFALKQWSFAQRASVNYLPFLGQDSYEQHQQNKKFDRHLPKGNAHLQREFFNFYNEKMYLLLALLCALIALIFVKI